MKNDFIKPIKYTAKIMDAWLPYKIQYDRIPGLSVGIMYKGKLVYGAGFGYENLELKKPATPETCYRIASISKMFTAVAILKLVEQCRIHLDDRIVKFLPWFRVKNKSGDSSNITIRQILSHTAGVFRDGDTPHWETDDFPDVNSLKKSISNKTIVFENLTRFKYSNFGISLLGEVIKEVSGLSYKDYVIKNIIQKVEMKNTSPDLTKKILDCLAVGYSRVIPSKEKERERFKHIETKAYAPATGFISNVVDLAKFLSVLSLKYKGKNNILGRESKKEIMKDYWQIPEEKSSYGLGLEIYMVENRKVVGHGGGFAGFITKISLDAENDIGVITLSNANDSSAGFINFGILESIYKLANNKSKYSVGKKIASQEKYEGAYRSRWNDEIIVGLDANLIAFDPRTNSPIKDATLLKPQEKNSFIMESNFSQDSPGEIAQFIFGNKKKKAKKLIWGSTPLKRI